MFPFTFLRKQASFVVLACACIHVFLAVCLCVCVCVCLTSFTCELVYSQATSFTLTSFTHEPLQRLTKEKSQALTETYKKEYRDLQKKKSQALTLLASQHSYAVHTHTHV
jgi:maltodextrin utilization protein YvdJ